MTLRRELSVNLGLPVQPLTDDKNLFQEMIRVYNALRILGYALDSYTGVISPPSEDWEALGASSFTAGGMHRVYRKLYENMTAGQTVSFMNDAGVAKARKAVVTTYPCHGFITTAGNAGEWGEFILTGRYPIFAPGSLTIGAKYYQSATAGAITSGATAQCIGFAITDQQLFFNPML